MSGFGQTEYYNASYIVITRIYDDETRLQLNNIITIINIHEVSNDDVTGIWVSIIRFRQINVFLPTRCVCTVPRENYCEFSKHYIFFFLSI